MSDRIQAIVILCLTLIEVTMLALYSKQPSPELGQQLQLIPAGIIGFMAGKSVKGENNGQK